MLKIKVIADNILNLTDARYFAAYGVDYLVFNQEEIPPQTIREIKDWVEGVSILLDVRTQLTPSLLDFILSLSPEGYVSDDVELLNDLKRQLPEANLFMREKNGNLVDLANKEAMPYVKLGSSPESLKEIIESENITGIIVEGEPEEKVGFKNFDELDEIFELIAI